MNPSISIQNVSKSFGKKTILKDIHFDIQEGNIYGFIGPSGAGKTTLVKMIVGMEVPDQGAIYLLGEKMPNLPILQEIGYMAQSDALYNQLTGKENLTFFASLYKLNKGERLRRIEYAAELVNLTSDLNKKVSAYSGGMKRRLSLAIALIQNPKVLILDEPTVGIDPELRESIWNELLRLKNEDGKTIIVTTHVMDEAEKCDYISMIREGSLIATGTPEQLKKQYAADNLNDVFWQRGGCKMRTIALIKRILLQILRDKRTLALLFIAPLLILTLMDLVFNGKTVNPVLGIENGKKQIIQSLKEADIVVKNYEGVSNTDEVMLKYDLDGLLEVKGEKATLTLLNDNPTVAKNLEMKVRQIFNKRAQLQLLDTNNIQRKQLQDAIIQTKYVYGSSDTELFDTFSPMLVGFFVFFFVFLISGIGLLNERTTGTLERLMATPIKRGEIVAAYLIGYGLLAFLQTIVIVLFAIYVLDIVLVGSIWNVILINVIVALVALSLGILLSSFANSEFQMVQFIPLVIVPQIFFSGIFSIEGMVDWLQVFAKFMPLYYAADALKGVMYKGLSLSDISQNLYILLAFAAVFIVCNLFALKKYRKL